MSLINPVECDMCGETVEIVNTVEMPNGRLCDDCYAWMEQLLEEEE